MQWIVQNWYLLVAAMAVGAGITILVRRFVDMPTSEQIAAVKKWLLLAVTNAEKELGGGTGKLKLRAVYEMFLTKFPWVADVVSFDTFSGWVDEALEEMREMLKSNKDVQLYVNGGEKND